MKLPAWAQRGLHYAPIAALSAVVIPEIVMTQGHLIDSWKDARLFAVATGVLWFYWRKGVLGTWVIGVRHQFRCGAKHRTRRESRRLSEFGL